MILAEEPTFNVVFEASNGKQFFERLSFELVDVVILDVEMPVMDGIETLKRLHQIKPEIKVLMLTMHDNDRLINHLMQLGASGFLLKDEDPEIVITAVKRVAEDGVYFRDYVSRALLKGSKQQNNRKGEALHTKLSERELQVLQLICKEHTSKEIAEQLFISYRTVEGHRRSMQEKTGAKNIVGLVLYAVERGMV
ncbi:MAG: DNA-binding NarL/FixJ family response regulator [Neolewinella sp.]|jgi:DNA-binding NarL/FixJ family response regulator